jgi:hypothetical protein
LLFGADLFAESGYRGLKRVIDISGDGPNNQGAPVDLTRDMIVAEGIVINGLPLMTRGGFSSVYDVTELDRYYTDCVIGGPGAFMIPVNDWSQFPEAIRRKLVMELVQAPPAVPSRFSGAAVQTVQADAGYDCLVGERMWRDRSRLWEYR